MDNLKTLVKNSLDTLFWELSKRELYKLLVSFKGKDGQTIVDITKAYKGYGWYKRLSSLQIDYDGVKKDFELWSPLVCSGGVIVFHDIIKSDRSSNYGVHILWEELKSTYKTEEIVLALVFFIFLKK